MKLEFSRERVLKNTQLSNFKKILQVGAQLFRADRYDKANNGFAQ